jgi:hypothetical protein
VTLDQELCPGCGVTVTFRSHCDSRTCPWETCPDIECGHTRKAVYPWR